MEKKLSELPLEKEELGIINTINSIIESAISQIVGTDLSPKDFIKQSESGLSIIDLQNKKDHIISIRDKIKNHRVSLVEQSQSSLLKAIENLKNGNTDIVIPQLQSIANDDLKPIKELEKTTAQLSVYVKALNELIREKN